MSIRFSETDIELDQKAILIKHVYEKCKEEYYRVKNLKTQHEINYEDKVMYLTGCSRDYLDKIITLKGISQNNIDVCKRVVGLGYINYFYNAKNENKELSFKDSSLLEKYYARSSSSALAMWNMVMKTEVRRYSIEDLLPTFNLLGFTCKNTLNYGPLPIENPLNMFERFQYFKKIKDFKSKSLKMYYIDMRIVDLNANFNKPWITGIDVRSTAIDGLVSLMLASSRKNEFDICSNVFINRLDNNEYRKWILNIVIPMLEPSSIVIIDNDPYFNKSSLVPQVSEYSTKNVMLQWLIENDIPCDSTMQRVELYELIKKYSKEKNPLSDIEILFNSYGHCVLRTPVNFDDLTPTGMLWNYMKEKFNCDYSKQLKENEKFAGLVKRSLDDLTKSKFESFIKITSKFELEISAVDILIESKLLDIVLI